ncbi:Pimeloyl-ACP methyl ester carboxylesterase [Hymenobacter daecheongensis DSM 21074]|uniref:Pimeloyl-ACP methyl ester carboxylesterase n=1 Tax=Hymenobacter daecheongensis DSM 21074 TaxID=1121955 RepID=A0A1M6A5M8_9BACT|nr:alpha/beta fold hydrolase [Hymenobacter daecheongensis]SHI31768.1 Pimeloyl-ACP methyl ester carboxylesterase [Hymenobacter daecheongensis DSM 21074]
MQLHFRELGQGTPLVILHGLFGTSDNWQTLAKRWSETHRVVVVDLRNHGRSPHAAEHSYELMSQDVLALFDQLGLPEATLLGHSMGGKVAMRFALDHPERLTRLIVLDIAPRLSDMRHQDDILAGLNAVNLATLQTRQEADTALAQHIPDVGVRQFLLKNLYRKEDNSFAWRQNLAALTAQMAAIGAEITGLHPFLKPALFLRGGKSDYISPEDKLYGIPALFPNSQVETVVDAGHWLHAEKPEEVYGLVEAFMG